MSWIKDRGGIKPKQPTSHEDAQDASMDQTAGVSEEPADESGTEPAVEPTRRRESALPRASAPLPSERGIPPINQGTGIRASAIFPIVVVGLLVATVWLLPSADKPAVKTPDDPRANPVVFDDAPKSAASIAPPPSTLAPPQEEMTDAAPPPQRPATAQPRIPAPEGIPPLRIIPTQAQQAGQPSEAAKAKPMTSFERRKQSKQIIEAPALDGTITPDARVPSPAALGGFPPAGLRTVSTAGDNPSKLTEQLRPSTLSPVSASLQTNRSLLLSQGAMIDCAMDVAISSAVPGLTKCTTTRDVYSDDGKALLLERGTELTGEQRGGMQGGQTRLFLLWTRARTPNGVIADLASPGTDSLGRSGVDGHIDTHFWDRFGAAILMSIIDDSISFATAKAQTSNNGGSTVVMPTGTTSAARGAASIIVENNVKISPTLTKNQGDHISVFVARDLDFRSVYELRPTNNNRQH